MMKVGVRLDDREFAQVLVKGLAAEGRNICFILQTDYRGDTEFDFILTERESDSNRQICLVLTPEEERIYDGPPYRIFRYQDARDFVRNLIMIHYRETGKQLSVSGDTRCSILAFTSLTGELETTALALSTGEYLYKHYGYRCLYLNLCPIDGSKCFLPGGSSKGLLTLLYYLDQEKDFPLEPFIRMHLHVDHIDTTISNPYFDELSSIQMQHLLKKIDQIGKYTYLILDMGNHLSRNSKALLAYAEEVIFVTTGTEQFPASFYDSVTDLLDGLTSGGRMRQVSLDIESPNETPPLLLQKNGLLDLSAMKEVHWEAARLVKGIMEHADD